MRVLHAASEAVPFAKTGGLADVVGALPDACAAWGAETLTVLPWYATLAGTRKPYWVGDVDVPFAGRFERVGIGTLEVGDRRFVFVGHRFFSRETLYGYADDSERFALFARSVPVAAQRVGFVPHVVHLHDWHAALVAPLLRYGSLLPPGFSGLPSVLTVHNAQHQGWADAADVVAWARLPGELTEPLSHLGRGNLLHAGLVAAGAVTTVSPSYSRELSTEALGCGLDAVFERLGDRLGGILNGIDVDAWNPQTDPALPHALGEATTGARAGNQAHLARRFALTGGRPALGVVSRFAEQKGIDVLIEAIPNLVTLGFNLALVGSGDPLLEVAARTAAAAFPGRVGVHVGYDDALARLVYGSCDALLIPSRFEPCGLTQMIAMRYGALPIARATGGLRDTIVDGIDGFLFDDLSVEGLRGAAARALTLYRAGEPWRAMQRRAMARDWSWGAPARAYQSLYLNLIGAP